MSFFFLLVLASLCCFTAQQTTEDRRIWFPPYKTGELVDVGFQSIILNASESFYFQGWVFPETSEEGMIVSKETCGVTANQFALVMNPDLKVHLRGLGFAGSQGASNPNSGNWSISWVSLDSFERFHRTITDTHLK